MSQSQENRLDLNDSHQGHSKYKRLRDHFLTEMKTGRLLPGQALPTEMELASQLKVSRSTVRLALAELDRDGLIERIRGQGTFVREEPSEQSTPGEASVASKLGLLSLVMPQFQAGHYTALQCGFERSASEKHSHVIVCSTDNDTVRQGNVILQLMAKNVSGVAMVPTTDPTPTYQIEMLQKQGIPIVFCHRRIEGVRAPLLAIPFLNVGRMAGRILAERGHRRVAMFFSWPLSMDDTLNPAKDYAIGLRESIRKSGGDLPNDWIMSLDSPSFDPDVIEKETWQKIEPLFSRPDHPSAIMTSYDPLGEFVYLALERLGLRVPEDVSIISFGGKERGGAITRRLTSVVIDGADVGRRAAQLLHDMGNGKRSIHDTEEIVLPLELSEGQSVGPAMEVRNN